MLKAYGPRLYATGQVAIDRRISDESLLQWAHNLYERLFPLSTHAKLRKECIWICKPDTTLSRLDQESAGYGIFSV